MRPMVLALFLSLVLLWQTGCAGGYGQAKVPIAPPPGYLFEQIKAPLSCNYRNTTANPGKTGLSKTQFLSIPFYPMISFAWQDPASVELAAANGGLKEIDYADYQVMSILGVYTEFTVVAHGN